jgi:hypothetical protein
MQGNGYAEYIEKLTAIVCFSLTHPSLRPMQGKPLKISAISTIAKLKKKDGGLEVLTS